MTIAAGTEITVTASSAIFTANDVGRTIRVIDGNAQAVITAYTSSTEVTAVASTDIAESLASGDWEFMAQPAHFEILGCSLLYLPRGRKRVVPD